jgi:restriction system protein
MGFVKYEFAEPNQTLKVVIIILEDDLCIRIAPSVTNNIEYCRYEVSFEMNMQYSKVRLHSFF